MPIALKKKSCTEGTPDDFLCLIQKMCFRLNSHHSAQFQTFSFFVLFIEIRDHHLLSSAVFCVLANCSAVSVSACKFEKSRTRTSTKQSALLALSD